MRPLAESESAHSSGPRPAGDACSTSSHLAFNRHPTRNRYSARRQAKPAERGAFRAYRSSSPVTGRELPGTNMEVVGE